MVNVFHWKVESTTINKTPVRVATGRSSINGDSAMTKSNMKIPLIVELTRCLAPFIMLMVDCPIIASPPIARKRPDTKLANPWANNSWFESPIFGTVSVISLQACSVKTDSTLPIAARVKPNVMTFWIVVESFGIAGQSNLGGDPLMGAVSLTVRVATSKTRRNKVCSSKVPTSNPTKLAGNKRPILGMRGKNFIIAIQIATCTNVKQSSAG
mmetsp:Transcript_41705/g.61717  ORF Transcript_41705/g.61717 Transcript_41705/m.61717 type:complete len:212 (+) Transcript_41705:931-1566(+)